MTGKVTLINTTDRYVSVVKKDGSAIMLSPRKKITVDACNYGELPAGVKMR